MPDPNNPPSTVKELQAALAQLQTDALALHRLAMLGTMSAMIVHEINNLVTPVLARAEAALASDDPRLLRTALERAATGVERAVAVARHLLELAQANPQRLSPCPLAEAVSAALAAATRPLDRDRIELSLAIADDLAIMAHPILLEQLLLNLILNARRAMAERGGILRIAAQRAGDTVAIEVSDTGVGLSQEAIQERFNPFLQAADGAPLDWRDVGLGLNVCRLVAQRCNAKIEFAANPGGGCIVRMHWPAAEAVGNAV